MPRNGASHLRRKDDDEIFIHSSATVVSDDFYVQERESFSQELYTSLLQEVSSGAVQESRIKKTLSAKIFALLNQEKVLLSNLHIPYGFSARQMRKAKEVLKKMGVSQDSVEVMRRFSTFPVVGKRFIYNEEGDSLSEIIDISPLSNTEYSIQTRFRTYHLSLNKE